MPAHPLWELLKPSSPIEIVDIGANPIDGNPPYMPLLKAELAHVTGFEPQQEALKELLAKKGPLERYLPYAIGDGKEHTLNICLGPGMSSLLTPDKNMLSHFEYLLPLSQVVRRETLATKRLDEVEEIHRLDFLKIDIQGAELMVFQHGTERLAEAVAIQTEISFMPLYEQQPTFGTIDVELRRQGFIPHTFAAIKPWIVAPMVLNNEPRAGLNQLLEADVVYFRDFTKPGSLSDEQLKRIALVSHLCYGSFDITMHCIVLLEARKALATGSHLEYLKLLQA